MGDRMRRGPAEVSAGPFCSISRGQHRDARRRAPALSREREALSREPEQLLVAGDS